MREQDDFLRDHFEFDHEHGNNPDYMVQDIPLHTLRKVRLLDSVHWGMDREETIIAISDNLDELRKKARSIRILSGKHYTTELQILHDDTGGVEILKVSKPYKPRKTKGRDYDLLGHIFSI